MLLYHVTYGLEIPQTKNFFLSIFHASYFDVKDFHSIFLLPRNSPKINNFFQVFSIHQMLDAKNFVLFIYFFLLLLLHFSKM